MWKFQEGEFEETSRWLFFGLHTHLPNIRQIRVFDSREAAMEMHGYASQVGEFGIGALHATLFRFKWAAISRSTSGTDSQENSGQKSV